MNRKKAYLIHTLIRYAAIAFFAFWIPTLILPENPLPTQLVVFTGLYAIERLSVYKNVDASFDAYEGAFNVLRNLLPLHISSGLHFHYDFYNPNSAKQVAANVQMAIEEILSEQSRMLTRYENLNSDLTHYVNAQQILLSISHDIVSIKSREELYDLFLSKALELIPGAEKGSLLLLNSDNTLNFVAAKGFELSELRFIKLNAYDSFLALNRTTLRTEPYIMNDMYQHNLEHLDKETYSALESATGNKIRATLTAPIVVDNEIYGMINLDSTRPNAFRHNDITSMLFFTTQLSFAIKNKDLFDKATYLSQYDKLTGLYNRSYFEENFSIYQDMVFRGKGTFVLALMDLNYLKKINDSYGHLAGDKALKAFADEMATDLPNDALFARYGGDEFIAIIPNMPLKTCETLFEASIQRFKHIQVSYNNISIPIRYAYGLSDSPDESMMLDILVKLADHRMYVHKEHLKQNEPALFTTIAQNEY